MTVIRNTMGIASSEDVGDTGVPQLFAGDTPPVVHIDVLLPAGARLQYVPLGDAYGAWAAGQQVSGITAYATPGGVRAAIYVEGCFNLDAIAWPAGTTEAQIQAASITSNLKFRRPLYSNKRTGTEPGPGKFDGPDSTT